LKQEVSKSGAQLKVAGTALEDLRIEHDEAAKAAAQEETQMRRRREPVPLKPADKLSIGEWVMILGNTTRRGSKAFVQDAMNSHAITVALHGSYEIVKVPKTQLARTTAPPKPQKLQKPQNKQQKTPHRTNGQAQAAPVRDYSKMAW